MVSHAIISLNLSYGHMSFEYFASLPDLAIHTTLSGKAVGLLTGRSDDGACPEPVRLNADGVDLFARETYTTKRQKSPLKEGDVYYGSYYRSSGGDIKETRPLY